MSPRLDSFDDARAVLADGGFDLEERDFGGLGSALIGETPLALVMVIELPGEGWETVVEDAQARLTTLAAAHPSARSWDLYLVLAHQGTESGARVRAAYERDTRYARKLFIGGDRAMVERSLLCLLPLHPLPEIKLADSLGAVQERLLAAGVEPELAKYALASFQRTSRVEIP